jgi:hypothetical protein
LVDQSGSLLDQGHFIAAQQAQPQHQRIGRRDGRPTLAFKAQRLGQGQAINAVGFDAAAVCARDRTWSFWDAPRKRDGP